MVADAEVITVAKEILSSLPVGTFLIKLNHRVLLDAVFELCGVPSDKFRTICSAVRKGYEPGCGWGHEKKCRLCNLS
jgi:histidyl-tRNA synthetase